MCYIKCSQKVFRLSLETCSICLNNFIHNKNIILLSCGHKLHKECFNTLLRFNYLRCPLCREFVEQLKLNHGILQKNSNREVVEEFLDEVLIQTLAPMIETD